jgi:hypothetical protein
VGERLRAQLAAFQRPATGKQLGAELTSQVLHVLVGGESPDAAALLRGIKREATADVLSRVLGSRADRFLTEVARGTSLEDALRVVQVEDTAHPLVRPAEMAELKQTMRTVVNNVPPQRQVLGKLASHPPSVDVLLEPHVDFKRLTATVEGMKRGTPGGPSLPRLGELITTYGDEFPSHAWAMKETPRSQWEPKWGLKPPAGPSRLPDKPLLPSRNIDYLRRLPRVGGVLIGQEPAGGVGLDLADLRWEVNGPSVRLILVGADRKEFRSRPHSRSLVHHALTYVADGRKVAVTICEAYPLKEHSILLHPTFVDTPMGRRVIELDQLIFRYSSKDPLYEKTVQDFYAQLALYRWAWAKRLLTVGDAELAEVARLLKPEHQANFLKGAGQLKEEARRVVDALDAKALEDALKARGSLRDPKLSPLTARTQYYEQKLVQLISSSAAGANTFEEFNRAFTQAAQAESRNVLERFRGGRRQVDDTVRKVQEINQAAEAEVQRAQRGMVDRRQAQARLRNLEQAHNAAVARGRQGEGDLNASYKEVVNWLPPPPRFGLRGIVKERPFQAELSQLLVADGAEVPVPFDFFLQMVFTDGPAFGPRDAGKAPAETDGWWEFTSLTATIQARVREGIAKDEKARAVLADVAEFTQLQRLFLAALQGKLGKNFPVEKLAALAEVTAPAAERVPARTLRWDRRDGHGDAVRGYEILGLLNGALRELDPDWKPTLFRKTNTKDLLESPELGVALGEWPAALLERLSRLEDGTEAERRWCRDTVEALPAYCGLLAESVKKHQEFGKQAAAVREAKLADATAAARQRQEWQKTVDEFLQWKGEWARKWEQNKSRQRLSLPEGKGKQASSKAARCVELLAAVVRLTDETSAALEFRQAVGVARDERQALEELLAPLPGLD